MQRLAILVSAFVVFSGVITFARGNAATAQDATMAAHPVVGLWRTVVSNTGAESFASLSTFHADGTYIEVLPDGTPSPGVWRPTGERTADLTFYVYFSIDDRLVLGEGRISVAVDESGNTMTEEGTVIGHYADDGSLAIAIESPAMGTRLQVLPVEPLGTPVLPPDEAATGTPAP
jgi:hypothetical protein